MTMRVNVDILPTLVRPTPVAKAIAEAVELRDRHRLAQEELARAQHELEQAQQADVAATAEKVRQGAAPGALPAAIAKAKAAVELAQRNAAAIGLAAQAAQDDVGSAITANASDWLSDLDAEAEHAREAGRAALAALRDAFARIADASGGQAWLAAATVDGRFDRPVKPMLGFALSSRHKSANAQPFSRDEVLAFVDELLSPPTPQPTEHEPQLRVAEAS